MNYIKSLHVEGFKKFQTLNVEFNEHMNILVGENEAGKSTISLLKIEVAEWKALSRLRSLWKKPMD